MNNDYKKECWKRYLENQKYKKYDKEDFVYDSSSDKITTRSINININ